jgi:hypothetical protein
MPGAAFYSPGALVC